MYFFPVETVVYDAQVLWDREEDQNASFCYAILNYKYKRNDVLFSYVVKVTQSHIDFDKFPCPNLEGEIANCYKRLNFIHQNHETLLQQRLEAGQPVDSFTTDDRLEVMRISPSSRIEPVVETGETTVSIEENNLSHPVANNEQSQLETDEPTQLDDERETHNIHSQLILNGLYP
ncbi:hypothetical protein TpMuguga_04g00192 [Theileria parva strain Muguga]|uniref:uncharacterized protein n=1 Tax=Theileria parva strain Muguga TaxID=333668 RepID=UPI001C61EF7D|nr:uncharacterized protein TpMuguga_04g00192 [Theileria parva strain Muguga]EAN31544.2 hypothetical protein TpMuguga_04g00192 [Theileria parva strain Muguga]